MHFDSLLAKYHNIFYCFPSRILSLEGMFHAFVLGNAIAALWKQRWSALVCWHVWLTKQIIVTATDVATLFCVISRGKSEDALKCWNVRWNEMLPSQLSLFKLSSEYNKWSKHLSVTADVFLTCNKPHFQQLYAFFLFSCPFFQMRTWPAVKKDFEKSFLRNLEQIFFCARKVLS